MADQSTPITETLPGAITTPITTQNITPPPPDKSDADMAGETFDALNKLLDAHPDAPPREAKAQPPEVKPAIETVPVPQPREKTPVGTETKPTTPQDAFESKLDAIQPLPDDHPNKKQGMEALKRISREEHARAEELKVKQSELEKKVTEFEEKLKNPTIPEDVERELKELRELRKDVDLRNDPEFQKEFVTPLRESEQDIVNMLKQAGLTEETANWIQSKGGLIAMASSSLPANDKQTCQQWVEDTLLPKTPTFYRNRIIAKLSDSLGVIDKMSKTLSNHEGMAQQRYEVRMKALTEEFNKGRDEAVVSLGEIAKPKPVTAEMPVETRVLHEAHNNLLREAESKYANYLKTSNDPKVSGEILVRATYASMLQGMYDKAMKQVAELQTKLDKVKSSGSHSLAGDLTPPPGITKPTQSEVLRTPTDKALTALLNEAGVP